MPLQQPICGPLHSGNGVFKYADDTHLVVPAANDDTCDEELKHIQAWADDNNLRLNAAKSKEIIFKPRGARGKSLQLPPPFPTIERIGLSQLRFLASV